MIYRVFYKVVTKLKIKLFIRVCMLAFTCLLNFIYGVFLLFDLFY